MNTLIVARPETSLETAIKDSKYNISGAVLLIVENQEYWAPEAFREWVNNRKLPLRQVTTTTTALHHDIALYVDCCIGVVGVMDREVLDALYRVRSVVPMVRITYA